MAATTNSKTVNPGGDPPPGLGRSHFARRSRNTWMVLGAVMAVAILVLGIVVYVGEHGPSSTPVPKPVGSFGPKVLVSGTGNAGGLANNTTINIQIFSAVPSAFESPGTTFQAPGLHIHNLSAQSPLNNGVNEELLNVTLFPQNDTTAFFLAPTFDVIDQQWIALLAHDQGRNYPSLTVEAVKTVISNGSAYLYQYTNNLLYDPSSLHVVNLNGTLLDGGAATWFDGTGIDPYSYSEVTVATLAFNLTLDFPSAPVQVVTSPNSGAGATVDGTLMSGVHTTACLTTDEYCQTQYVYNYYYVTSGTLESTSFANGTLPLLGVHIGRNADSGGSVVIFSADVNVVNDTIDLNSAQPYVSSTNETTTSMTTTPSFAHTANVTVGNSIGQYGATPIGLSENNGVNESLAQNRSTAFAGINGVEYEFQHFNRYTYEHETYNKETLCCTGSTCHGSNYVIWDKVIKTTYDGGYTSGGINHINSTAGLEVQASWQSIWTAWVIQHTLAVASNGTLTLATNGSDSSYEAAAIWAATTGYLDASDAYSQAAGALKAFSTAISLGFAIICTLAAANGLDADATEPSVVAASVSLITDTIGLAADVLGEFSSISAYTGTEAITVAYGFSNYPITTSGSAYTMPFFESKSAVSFTVNGNTYSFYAPEDYLNATAIA